MKKTTVAFTLIVRFAPNLELKHVKTITTYNFQNFLLRARLRIYLLSLRVYIKTVSNFKYKIPKIVIYVRTSECFVELRTTPDLILLFGLKHYFRLLATRNFYTNAKSMYNLQLYYCRLC